MSVELDAINALAANYSSHVLRLSATSVAVLFYATPYLTSRNNWIDHSDPYDTVTDEEWDTISAYVDGLLYEAKNPMIGLIMPFVTADPPPDVLPCDGAEYLREDYPILYDVLDAAFIVDADHFIVPDLRGRTIIGAGDGSGLTTRNVGDTGGEENHELTESEIPSHSHTIPLTFTTLAVEPGEVAVLSPVPILTDSTGSTGGDDTHNNMQPFYVLNYGIIAR